MEIIKKKVGNIEFVWDPNSYQGQGGWYKILKGRKNKPDGYGRSANAKEKKLLGVPVSKEPIDESSEDDEDFDPNSRSREYREARRIGNRSLLEMFAENYDTGKGFGGSLKEGLSELAKAKATSFKEKLDPLSIANNMAGPFAAWALGRAMGRSEDDIQYFSGIGRKKKQMASKIKEAPSAPTKKIGSLDTALYSAISENQQRRFRKGDGTATLLARMLNLMKKYHEEDIVHQEKEHKRELEQEDKREKFNKRMAAVMKTAGASAGPGGPGNDDGAPTSNMGYLGGIIKGFLAGKAGRFFLAKLLKTRFGKALIRTKVGRFLVKSSLKLLSPFKGSPLAVAKNLAMAPIKTVSSIAKFLTPSAKVAGEAVKGASTASKVATVAEKPGFLKTAEEKIAERSARIAAEKGTPEAVKASAKVAAEATKESMKGIEKAGAAAEKVVGKKIPVLGAILGAGFAVERAMKGDYLGAGGELLSGLLSTVPGLGTAASLAIDGALIARDLSKEDEAPTAKPDPTPRRGYMSGMTPRGTPPKPPETPAATNRPTTTRKGPSGEPPVVDNKGRLGYMKRNGRTSIFVPFESEPEKPKATPVPAQPNQTSVRLQEAIKTNEDNKLDSKAPIKPIVVEANKTVSMGSNSPDFIDYGGDFNVRETDPSLFWVLKTNIRPV